MRKTQKFCKIIALDLSYVVTVKSKVEILQNFVAFPEYMNFTENVLTTYQRSTNLETLFLH